MSEVAKKNNVIVSAAMLVTIGEDSLIIASPRHFDSVARASAAAVKPYFVKKYPTLSESQIQLSIRSSTQGFVDRFGDFHSRTDAWKIAHAANQIKHRCGGDDTNGGTLFSENLY